jgi:ATP-dependent DNA helicase RecG
MTDYKLSADSKVRISTMVKTNNGFDIAETDLSLRGPGDLMGTQQSGVLDLLIADLGRDGEILKKARETAIEMLRNDPDLSRAENREVKIQVASMSKAAVNWSRIS